MKHWSLVHIVPLATGYVLVILCATIGWALRINAIKRGPSGAWHFLWLIPYTTARNYLLLLLLPPCLLLIVWLMVRRTL